jgi:multiple sugar transport system substrate-binding protein
MSLPSMIPSLHPADLTGHLDRTAARIVCGSQFLLQIVFLGFVLLVGPSCGQERPRLVLAVGGAPAELSFWAELVQDFSRQSGHQLELRRQPADSDQQRQGLIIALDGRQSDPDVFLMDVAWIGLFAAAGWLRPLSGMDTSPFFTKVVDEADRYRGRLLALPVYMDGGVLYYRRDLLERFGIAGPPQTQEELRRTAQRVQAAMRPEDRSFHGFVWEGAQYEGLVVNFMEFAGSRGGFRRQDGVWRLDSPANRHALRFMYDLIHVYEISPQSTYTEMREEEVRLAFQGGHALYDRNWPYAWALHQAPGSPVRGKVGVAPLPAPPDGKSVSALGGWHVGISRFSDEPEAARQLVVYLTSRTVQKRMMLELGWNPGRQDLYADPEILAAAPHLEELARVFRQAVPRPNVPYYPQLSAVAQRHLNSALAGDESPAQALARIDSRLAALAARYAPAGDGRQESR